MGKGQEGVTEANGDGMEVPMEFKRTQIAKIFYCQINDNLDVSFKI